jgi:hypothetical protein
MKEKLFFMKSLLVHDFADVIIGILSFSEYLTLEDTTHHLLDAFFRLLIYFSLQRTGCSLGDKLLTCLTSQGWDGMME